MYILFFIIFRPLQHGLIVMQTDREIGVVSRTATEVEGLELSV